LFNGRDAGDVACPKSVAAISGSFAGDVPEGACVAEFYLNLGGTAAAVSVGRSAGMWVGGLRQGSGTTSVTVNRTLGGNGAAVACSTVHSGMYAACQQNTSYFLL
jgi:hypothetical protein